MNPTEILSKLYAENGKATAGIDIEVNNKIVINNKFFRTRKYRHQINSMFGITYVIKNGQLN